MSVIYQLVACFREFDAISNEAIVFQDLFRSWGHTTAIATETRRVPPSQRRHVIDMTDLPARCCPDDLCLLHLSIGSPVNDVFAKLPCRKAILYHNMTPSHYFEGVNPQTARVLARGRAQLQALANVTDVNMADSSFNAEELAAAGYRDVSVLPLLLETRALEISPDQRLVKQLAPTTNVLFVGRAAPNKRIEDALFAYLCFRKSFPGPTRFLHVGSRSASNHYLRILRSIVRGLPQGEVRFAGAVSQTALAAYYRSANVFLCTSEHEGFCAPLLESMFYGVPVLARAAAAVPETLGGAGVLFRGNSAPDIAEMMLRLCTDAALRTAVLKGQRQRLQQYRARDLGAELKQHLAPLFNQ